MSGVIGTTEANVANAVIVDVDRITDDVKRRLAELPGVSSVEEDIQALPQTADEEVVRDFLDRVKALRGEEHVPPLIETRPVRRDDVRTDGGQLTIAADAPPAEPSPQATIGSIDDSIAFTGARALHGEGIRGGSVICVNVDTGACGSAIDSSRQLAGLDLSGENDPYTQLGPHGPYTLGIMAGDTTTPGVTEGYAPDSDVFPIKTTLASSEIIQAQDAIVQLAEDTGKHVIVCNSWAFVECEGLCGLTVTGAVNTAAQHPLVTQVFAAGNQATGDPACGQACDGSTIGICGPNSLDSVLAVAASGVNGDTDALHGYSSRGGPGSISCGTDKPDIAAPIFGTVPWGCDSTDIGNSGGTSGACPQVAGAAALLIDAFNQRGQDFTQADVFDAFETTGQQFLGSGFSGCTGWGNVQAAAAADVQPTVGAGVPTASKVIAGAVALAFAGAVLRRELAS